MLTIRRAAASDAAGVEAIYTPYVLGSYATFAFEPPTVDYWRHRIVDADRDLGHELLLAEDAGAVIGFAAAAEFRPKEAYRPTVEVSVYVSRPRSGVGKALYESLFADLDAGSAHRAVAGIALPNDASVRLHEGFGFRHVGTLSEVGHKLGAWRDLAYYERPIGSV